MQKLRGKCMNNLRTSPPKFLQKPSPFFHGAFVPSFIWRRRPWSLMKHYSIRDQSRKWHVSKKQIGGEPRISAYFQLPPGLWIIRTIRCVRPCKTKKRLEHKILGMSTVLNSGVTNVKQREQLPQEQQARGAHRPNQKYF